MSIGRGMGKKGMVYPTIKKNEIGSFVEMGMDPESVLQSDTSQKEKNKYHISTQIYGS